MDKRSDVAKLLHGSMGDGDPADHKFTPEATFPLGTLPTVRDVIQMLLAQDAWTRPPAVTPVVDSLVERWKYCSVLPTGTSNIRRIVKDIQSEFYR